MKKIELLAPAGDQESLIAAIQNGANAIYLGGSLFNARAYAKNFDNEQLKWAVEYAHLRDVKIYVTVNILYKDSEFSSLIDYVDYLYSIQVDALIIQDIGLFQVVHQRYPDFEIHMSTQASIMNQYAVQYFEELGASRVVLARENTIGEISQICKNTHLDIEVFIHGALCVCYSGQCLMSSFIGKRSGNKGACAQPCRLQYKLLKDGQELDEKYPFLLSPKDLMTINDIGQLIDAGVTSFKIEGRMKRPEYVGAVVKSYRQAIDSYLNKQFVKLDENINLMKTMFNRDYTKGFLFNDAKLVKGDYSGNKGILIGRVLKYLKKEKRVQILLEKPLKQGDSIVFEDIDKGRPVNKIFVNHRLVNQAFSKDIAEVEFDYRVTSGNVRKTVDVDTVDIIRKSYQKESIHLPVSMHFYAKYQQPAMLTIKYKDIVISKKTNEFVERALKTPLTQERVREQLSKLGQTTFVLKDISMQIDENITLPIKTLNQLRRECIEELSNHLSHKKIHFHSPKTLMPLNKKISSQHEFHILVTTINQLKTVLKNSKVEYVYYSYQHDALEAYKLCQLYKKKMNLFIPRICKDEDLAAIKNDPIYQLVDTVIVNDFGAYQMMKDKTRIAGTGFNIYNSYACQFFDHLKILSLEITGTQLNNLETDLSQCMIQVYGKIENMISEYCPISQYYFGYQKKHCQLCKKANYSLKDRKNEIFDLMMDEQCRMHLLNCRILLFDKYKNVNVGHYLIHFTNETSEDIDKILKYFIDIPNFRKPNKEVYTLGYYND